MSIFWKTNPFALLAHFLLDVTLSARSRRRQVAALRHLDDRLLKDIGLNHRDISLLQSGLMADDGPFGPGRTRPSFLKRDGFTLHTKSRSDIV